MAQKGFAADEITVTADGTAVFSDNAESADAAWKTQGLLPHRRVHHQRLRAVLHRREPSVRVVRQDAEDRPVQLRLLGTDRPDWVEHYAYQNGLLIWKWDTSQADNNTSQHQGIGLILPVDAHPAPLKWSDGTLMRNRIQAYDSPFSTFRRTASRCTTRTSRRRSRRRAGVPVFNDHTNTYYERRTRPPVSRSLTPTPRSRSSRSRTTAPRSTVEVGPAVK